MAKFEIVSKYADAGLNLPVRATAHSAGYDFEVAEDIVVLPINKSCEMIDNNTPDEYFDRPLSLDIISNMTKELETRPVLIPTGIKCKLADDEYLELSVRSSCPLKYWLVLANGVGIIDADYYNNESNEGEIFFQVINLSPLAI